MNNLNSTLIEGVLERDAEYRTTPQGTSVCSFVIESKQFYKKEGDDEFKQESSFFTVETWGKLADAVRDCGKNGRGCRVVGRLRQYRWQSPGGETQSKVTIVAEHVEFRP
jgi:single-strand DNA-binding protein